MRYRLLICCICCAILTSSKSQTLEKTILDTTTEIAFVSDTQSPLWIEKMMLKSNKNRRATRMIFTDITARRPLSLFLLGDVVSLGSSNRAWSQVNRHLDTLRSNGVQVLATMGNHELMGTGVMGRRGQEKFQLYFPEYIPTGFAQVIDSVAVILLNSNFRSLTKADDSTQLDWYAKTLENMDADPSIQYIITGCHHSPYSNSKIVGSSKAVQQKFVRLFIRSKKTCLFLSGHSHAFEHFKRDGKNFLVIGGGGGIHQPLGTGKGELTDLSPHYKPMFHYLTIRINADRLTVASHKLKTDFTGFETGLTIDIHKPEADL